MTPTPHNDVAAYRRVLTQTRRDWRIRAPRAARSDREVLARWSARYVIAVLAGRPSPARTPDVVAAFTRADAQRPVSVQ